MATSSSSGDIYIKILADLSDIKGQLGSLNTAAATTADKIKGAFDGVAGGFAKVGLALDGIRQSLGLILAPIRSVVSTSAEFETLQTRLTGLYGSVEAGNRAFERFNEVASKTPFSLKGVVEAGAQLKAFGADAEGLILNMSDLAAFMGTDIVEAANSFGRAFAGGAGAADVLRDKGILNLIKSFKGIEDLTKLTLPEFRDALISTMRDPAANIAGSSERLSQTFDGAVSNMMDSLDRLRDAIGDGLRGPLTALAGTIGAVFDGLRVSLAALVPVIIVAVSGLAGLSAGLLVTRLTMATTVVGMDIFGMRTVVTVTAMQRLRAILDIVAARAAALGVVLNRALLLNPIGAAVTVLAALGTALLFVRDKAEEAKDGVAALGNELTKLSVSEFWATIDGRTAQLKSFAEATASLTLKRPDAAVAGLATAVSDATQGMGVALRLGEGAIDSFNKALDGLGKGDDDKTAAKIEAAGVLEEAAAKRSYETQRAFLQKQLATLQAAGDTKVVEAAKVQVQLQDLERQHQKDLADMRLRARQDAIAADNALAEQRLARQEFWQGLERQQREDWLSEDLGLARTRAQEIASAETESTEARLALLDRLAEAHFDNAQALQAIDEESQRLRAQSAKVDADLTLARLQIHAQAVTELSVGIGNALGAGIMEGTAGLKQALKQVLLTILDYIKQLMIAARLAAWAKAGLTLNPFEIALKLAPMEILFAALRTGITAFKVGGLVRSPTLAMIGEAGEPEYVGPKRKFEDELRAEYKRGAMAGDGVAHKLLAGLNDRMSSVEQILLGQPRAIGRETGRALSSVARAAV